MKNENNALLALPVFDASFGEKRRVWNEALNEVNNQLPAAEGSEKRALYNAKAALTNKNMNDEQELDAIAKTIPEAKNTIDAIKAKLGTLAQNVSARPQTQEVKNPYCKTEDVCIADEVRSFYDNIQKKDVTKDSSAWFSDDYGSQVSDFQDWNAMEQKMIQHFQMLPENEKPRYGTKGADGKWYLNANALNIMQQANVKNLKGSDRSAGAENIVYNNIVQDENLSADGKAQYETKVLAGMGKKINALAEEYGISLNIGQQALGMNEENPNVIWNALVNAAVLGNEGKMTANELGLVKNNLITIGKKSLEKSGDGKGTLGKILGPRPNALEQQMHEFVAGAAAVRGLIKNSGLDFSTAMYRLMNNSVDMKTEGLPPLPPSCIALAAQMSPRARKILETKAKQGFFVAAAVENGIMKDVDVSENTRTETTNIRTNNTYGDWQNSGPMRTNTSGPKFVDTPDVVLDNGHDTWDNGKSKGGSSWETVETGKNVTTTMTEQDQTRTKTTETITEKEIVITEHVVNKPPKKLSLVFGTKQEVARWGNTALSLGGSVNILNPAQMNAFAELSSSQKLGNRITLDEVVSVGTNGVGVDVGATVQLTEKMNVRFGYNEKFLDKNFGNQIPVTPSMRLQYVGDKRTFEANVRKGNLEVLWGKNPGAYEARFQELYNTFSADSEKLADYWNGLGMAGPLTPENQKEAAYQLASSQLAKEMTSGISFDGVSVGKDGVALIFGMILKSQRLRLRTGLPTERSAMQEDALMKMALEGKLKDSMRLNEVVKLEDCKGQIIPPHLLERFGKFSTTGKMDILVRDGGKVQVNKDGTFTPHSGAVAPKIVSRIMADGTPVMEVNFGGSTAAAINDTENLRKGSYDFKEKTYQLNNITRNEYKEKLAQCGIQENLGGQRVVAEGFTEKNLNPLDQAKQKELNVTVSAITEKLKENPALVNEVKNFERNFVGNERNGINNNLDEFAGKIGVPNKLGNDRFGQELYTQAVVRARMSLNHDSNIRNRINLALNGNGGTFAKTLESRGINLKNTLKENGSTRVLNGESFALVQRFDGKNDFLYNGGGATLVNANEFQKTINGQKFNVIVGFLKECNNATVAFEMIKEEAFKKTAPDGVMISGDQDYQDTYMLAYDQLRMSLGATVGFPTVKKEVTVLHEQDVKKNSQVDTRTLTGINKSETPVIETRHDSWQTPITPPDVPPPHEQTPLKGHITNGDIAAPTPHSSADIVTPKTLPTANFVNQDMIYTQTESPGFAPVATGSTQGPEGTTAPASSVNASEIGGNLAPPGSPLPSPVSAGSGAPTPMSFADSLTQNG